MDISNLIPHIESLIFASDKPLTSPEITDLINSAFGFMDEKISTEQTDVAIEGIVEKYSAEFYPFEVRQSGGGWQFLTKKEFHKTVAQLNGEKFLKRLSSAALETLAIVAYKQPVTKGEIEAIRGVSTDYAMQKLLEKELVVITGRNEKLPGHPLVYATSKSFMDYFGINSAEELPKIKEVLADQLVMPTAIHHTDFESQIAPAEAESEMLSGPALNEAFDVVTDLPTNSLPAIETANVDNASRLRDQPSADEDFIRPDTETIEDEIAEEDFIASEIFADEDAAIEELKLDEELADAPGDIALEGPASTDEKLPAGNNINP